jgi:uncharacterized protein
MRFLDTSRVRVRLDQRVVTVDGTELSVDLYLPPHPGRYPVLLHRTPADNNRWPRIGSPMPQPAAADRWKAYAAQRFIVATADVRGRGDSGGVFAPFVHEGADAAATVDWLRKLPECDGTVGAFGSGYAAFCAWAAIAAGARIDAIASISPFGAIGEGLVHRGGAARLDWLFWMHLIGGRTLQPPALPPWPAIHRHLPLRSMDTALGRADIPWKAWLEHFDPEDPFWAPVRLAERLAARPVPGLHVTGWWDAQLGGARYYYEAARRSGAAQSLIIGPWDSAAVRRPASVMGGFDFGLRSMIEIDEILPEFFGAQLRGEANQWTKPNTRYFVTGRNEWVDGEGWPAGIGESRELHLASGGCANTRRGDGVLSEAGSASSVADEVTDNPAMPVEFQAAFKSFAAGEWALSLDQAHITARDEALVYTSVPLTEVLTVCGRPSVSLTVRCDGPDADIYVLLSDVFPLGSRDLHLSHAAVRLAAARKLTPKEPLVVRLTMDEVAHDFLPGHSVRLTVVPSLFPVYARNLHQACYLDAMDPAVTTIALYHGGPDVAYLRLPVDRVTLGAI